MNVDSILVVIFFTVENVERNIIVLRFEFGSVVDLDWRLNTGRVLDRAVQNIFEYGSLFPEGNLTQLDQHAQ